MDDTSIPPGSSEPWSARPELMPKCDCSGLSWTIQAGGGPSCHGGWDLHWFHVKPGA